MPKCSSRIVCNPTDEDARYCCTVSYGAYDATNNAIPTFTKNMTDRVRSISSAIFFNSCTRAASSALRQPPTITSRTSAKRSSTWQNSRGNTEIDESAENVQLLHVVFLGTELPDAQNNPLPQRER